VLKTHAPAYLADAMKPGSGLRRVLASCNRRVPVGRIDGAPTCIDCRRVLGLDGGTREDPRRRKTPRAEPHQDQPKG